jgi:hypothetical protein
VIRRDKLILREPSRRSGANSWGNLVVKSSLFILFHHF